MVGGSGCPTGKSSSEFPPLAAVACPAPPAPAPAPPPSLLVHFQCERNYDQLPRWTESLVSVLCTQEVVPADQRVLGNRAEMLLILSSITAMLL